MRHFLSPRPPAADLGHMHPAATVARLVAPPSLLDRAAARMLHTAAGAKDLTAVTAAANNHLPTAIGTQEQTA